MRRLVLLCPWLLAGALAPNPAPAQDRPAPIQSQGIVYSIDGSGHLHAMSQDLSKAIAEANVPLQVEPVNWSHGVGRILSDLRGSSYHRTKGQELAGAIQAQRRDTPHAKLYIVSHSSGAAVALAATEGLPPGSIDRMILLAPAVSAGYDLRPALKACRDGIDVFYSNKDMISMSLNIVGTTDGRYFGPAGQNGFRFSVGDGEDRALYGKLRQLCWDNGMGKSGNSGGHFGFTNPGFFKEYVVPILATPAGVMLGAPEMAAQPPAIRASDLQMPGRIADRPQLQIP